MPKDSDNPKRKRHGQLRPVREILEAEEEKPEFRVIDGLRYVVPYNFILRTYAKKRWFNKNILEVLTKEFQAYPSSYYQNALASGKITVNGQKVPPDYKLQDHDFIAHRVHRHEPPILDKEIETIVETSEVLVVNKPASIPIHTTGRYRHNTLLKILELRHSRKLYTCHRLDRLTSGIIVILKNAGKATDYGALFRDQKVTKTYIALCAGEFPHDGLICTEPILQVCHKLGINKVDHNLGKPAQTDFKHLYYDNVSNRSLVLCMPYTGKMHQIRVHLAHHGYPIPNDPIYSRENWAKKSTPEFSMELTKALFKNDNITDFPGKTNIKDTGLTAIDHQMPSNSKEVPSLNVIESNKIAVQSNDVQSANGSSISDIAVSGEGIKLAKEISITEQGSFCLDGRLYKRIPQLSYKEECPECSWTRLVPQPEDMFIYLHAVRYQLDGHVYVSPLPEWCPKEWIPKQFYELLNLN